MLGYIAGGEDRGVGAVLGVAVGVGLSTHISCVDAVNGICVDGEDRRF